MIETITPSAAARLLLLAHLRVHGGAGSGNFGHAGRPGEVGGSGDSALLAELKKNTDIVRSPTDTRFILPNGTRLGFGSWDQDTHAQVVGSRNKVDRLLQLGVIRYLPAYGAEFGGKITDAQAKIVADDFVSWRVNPMFSIGRTSKEFSYLDLTDSVVYDWVNAHVADLKAAGGPGSGNFDHAGRPGEVGGSASGASVVGSASAKAAVHDTLSKLPAAVRNESSAHTIFAYDDKKIAADKIDEYLMKHYGFTASESAKGLVDRERGVMYTLTDPKETFRQFAHSLGDRIESPEWQNFARDQPTPKAKEDLFVKYFTEAFNNTAQLTNPVSFGLESAYHVFHKWGWL